MARIEKLNLNVVNLRPYTVLTVPSAAANKHCIILVTNGGGASGYPCIAVSNGSAWYRADGSAVAASS